MNRKLFIYGLVSLFIVAVLINCVRGSIVYHNFKKTLKLFEAWKIESVGCSTLSNDSTFSLCTARMRKDNVLQEVIMECPNYEDIPCRVPKDK